MISAQNRTTWKFSLTRRLIKIESGFNYFLLYVMPAQHRAQAAILDKYLISKATSAGKFEARSIYPLLD